MNGARLARVGGGLAAIVGGLLVVVAAIVGWLFIDFENFAVAAATGTYIFVALLFLLGAILVLGGLVGLYAPQSEEAGSLGLVGFLVTFLGMALVAGAPHGNQLSRNRPWRSWPPNSSLKTPQGGWTSGSH